MHGSQRVPDGQPVLGEVRRWICNQFRRVSRVYKRRIVAPQISSILNITFIKMHDWVRSRNNGKTGMIHMVSDLVGTLCEQIMMVLGKVTVQIFCMTSLKIKTRVLGLSEMHSE